MLSFPLPFSPQSRKTSLVWLQFFERTQALHFAGLTSDPRQLEGHAVGSRWAWTGYKRNENEVAGNTGAMEAIVIGGGRRVDG